MMVQVDAKHGTNSTESFMVTFDFAKTPITQIADYIIIAAAKYKTSDIHFDPREDGLMVRFRIDGDCQDYTFIPKAYERNLTTRLKLLANMNITESRLPQDGAIKGQFGDVYLDMRVSCLPVNEGEKIVIRILDYTRSLQGIDSLGFHADNLVKIKRMMGVPNGIILVTGATGSGKSTTTYSMLSELNKAETNVITVEDPIEMNIEGINQVQVNSEIGMTFAAALRSILRQDPNVILIGEIRDSETAQIAVRASITGHLVLSTLHTNNALATIERLLDMDVERYLLSTALTGVVAQRLAKQLCPSCRFQRETTQYEKKVFKKFLKKDVQSVWDANHDGCEKCRKGYRGRIAIHEVLELNEDIRNALNNEKLEKAELTKMVYNNGTITLLQDALIKCLDGLTSFEEVYRTIEIENEQEITEDEEPTQNNNEENINEIVTESNQAETIQETTQQEETIQEEQTVEESNVKSLIYNENKYSTYDEEIDPTQFSDEILEIPGMSSSIIETKPIENETTTLELPNIKTENTEDTINTTDSNKNTDLGYTVTITEDDTLEEITTNEDDENENKKPKYYTPKENTEEETTDETNHNTLGYTITMTENDANQDIITPTVTIEEETDDKPNNLGFTIVMPEDETDDTQKSIFDNLDEGLPEENETPSKIEEQSETKNTIQSLGDDIIPNIQAVSALTSLSDRSEAIKNERIQEVRTASEVLLGPGIRIAPDYDPE